MTSDLDPYATAKLLLKRHGEVAWFEAAQKADAMLEAGDMEAAARWKRVLAASGTNSSGPCSPTSEARPGVGRPPWAKEPAGRLSIGEAGRCVVKRPPG